MRMFPSELSVGYLVHYRGHGSPGAQNAVVGTPVECMGGLWRLQRLLSRGDVPRFDKNIRPRHTVILSVGGRAVIS